MGLEINERPVQSLECIFDRHSKCGVRGCRREYWFRVELERTYSHHLSTCLACLFSPSSPVGWHHWIFGKNTFNRYWNALRFRVDLCFCCVIGTSLECAWKGDYCCLRARTASTGMWYMQRFSITAWMLLTRGKRVFFSLLINGEWSISIPKLDFRRKGRLSPVAYTSHVIQAWRRPPVYIGLSCTWGRGFALCLTRQMCGSSHGTLEGPGLYMGPRWSLGLLASVLPPWQCSEVQPESLLAWKECEQAWARAWA